MTAIPEKIDRVAIIGYAGSGKSTLASALGAKMGAEVIPGLLESIRKATTERKEYGNGKKAADAKA